MNAGAFAWYSNRWEQPQAIDFSAGCGSTQMVWLRFIEERARPCPQLAQTAKIALNTSFCDFWNGWVGGTDGRGMFESLIETLS